jgi:hypothetical protein
MADVITRAADINYVCDAVNTLRTYLYEYSEDRYLNFYLSDRLKLPYHSNVNI